MLLPQMPIDQPDDAQGMLAHLPTCYKDSRMAFQAGEELGHRIQYA